ncbi:lipopolysaccharide export system protein LptC [Azomonas agilis]|uniref:Lipopolysaccharide export system protein LptC n=1 Tax=Azomonas agilis TaxID=116849 RepID=A0A562J0W9_9GAMM|nr:LPS export ABC transporter periplasmic protein LptC [Azomonas agilis]TWH76750.1 lipopolysaccharide export system protein LptC [Azomonas agilis]
MRMPSVQTLLLWIPSILLLAAVGYWNIGPDSFQKKPYSITDNDVDFFALNSRTIQYRADGKRQYDLVSEKFEHLKSTDISLLTQPDMHLYRGMDIPWRIRSARGEVSPNGTEIELIDQVRVERTDARNQPIILTSTRMTVFPDKQYAQTQQPVKIDTTNGVTTAVGMKAYLDVGKMHLLSHVRGQYELR